LRLSVEYRAGSDRLLAASGGLWGGGRCLCAGRWPGWLEDLGPWVFCREVWHIVFRELLIHECASAFELRALPTPASMVGGSTVDTAFRAVGDAVCCAMLMSTGTARVSCSIADASDVTKSLASRTMYGLLLVLANFNALFVYAYALFQDAIRRLGICYV
jgi:hypothetical protein